MIARHRTPLSRQLQIPVPLIALLTLVAEGAQPRAIAEPTGRPAVEVSSLMEIEHFLGRPIADTETFAHHLLRIEAERLLEQNARLRDGRSATAHPAYAPASGAFQIGAHRNAPQPGAGVADQTDRSAARWGLPRWHQLATAVRSLYRRAASVNQRPDTGERRGLAGTVVDPDGHPLVGAVLELLIDEQVVTSTVTGRDGGYRLTAAVSDGVDRGELIARGPGLFTASTRSLEPVPTRRTIDLPAGQLVTVDLRGVTGASLAGTITEDGSGTPLENVSVYALSTSGGYLGSDRTDATGAYQIDGLPAGDVIVQTRGGTGEHVDEVWNDITCLGGACNATYLGQAVSVSDGQTTANIDFALAPGGIISGVIEDQTTGNPLMSANLVVLDPTGEQLPGSSLTGADGLYQTAVLPPGDYYLKAWSRTESYVPEIWNDIPCLPNRCVVSAGTLVTVTAGGTTPVDVTLRPGASIRGSVTASGISTPLTGWVDYHDDDGQIYSARIASDGTYEILGLPPDTYYLTTRNWDGYFDELWDDLPFEPTDDVTAGTPIQLTYTEHLENVDFELDAAGAIEGSLRMEISGAPLPWAYLQLWNGTTFLTGRADGEGDFRVEHLPSGSYWLWSTVNDPTVLDERWQDVSTYGTDMEDGTPVIISGSETVSGIHFTLLESSSIEGRVTDSATGLGVEGATVLAWLPFPNDPQRGTSRTTTTAADGTYVLRTSEMLAGDYAVWVEHEDYVRQHASGVYCSKFFECAELEPKLQVPSESAVTGIDFSLRTGLSIGGAVTGRTSGEAIDGVALYLYDSTGRPLESGGTSADGTFEIDPVPASGYYFLSTVFVPEGWLRETWTDQPSNFWPGANPALLVWLGTPIQYLSPAPFVADFELDTQAEAKTFSLEVASGEPGAGGAVDAIGELCIDTCDVHPLPTGAQVRLTPFPFNGSALSHYGGDPDCADGVITVTEDKSCTAVFDLGGVFADGFESGDLASWGGPGR